MRPASRVTACSRLLPTSTTTLDVTDFLKLGASTVIVYVAGVRLGTEYTPSSLVVTVRTNVSFFVGSRTVTVAPATVAPFASLTVPVNEPVVSCPKLIPLKQNVRVSAAKRANQVFFIIFLPRANFSAKSE